MILNYWYKKISLFLRDKIKKYDYEEINEKIYNKYENIINEMKKEIHDIINIKWIKINNI